MMKGMDAMGWMMGGMGLVWLLIVIVLILAIAALVKYLRSRQALHRLPQAR